MSGSRACRRATTCVAALEWVEDGQWLNPQFLQRLRPLATKAVLEPGQTAAVQLKLVQSPQLALRLEK